MTIRRPTRRTGKYALQASAQSVSSTRRVWKSPNWPQAERLEMPQVARDIGDGRVGCRPIRPRAPRPWTVAGRLGSTRAPRPSSTRSNAGSTEVPAGAYRPRILLTASTASTSATTESSSHAPPEAAASPEGVTDLVEEAPGGVGDLARLVRERGQQFLLALRQLRRHDDVDQHVEVAARPAARCRCGTPFPRSRILGLGRVPGSTRPPRHRSTVGTMIRVPERAAP